MWKSIYQVLIRVTSRRHLTFLSLVSTLFFFELGQSTFCPVTSPNDEIVYVTDTPTKLMIGATKTGCAIDCLSSNCRCINYNVTSLNCSVFNFEPKSYAVDKSNNTVAYQLVHHPLKGLWFTVPVTNCSFPFIYQGLKYCGCRRGVMFPNDQICKKSYYSCQLKNGKPAYCDAPLSNSPVNTPGCSLNSFCSGSTTNPCTCNAGYSGDGFTCTDINECLTNNGGCSTNATCTNNPGNFTCSCVTGYTGNGFKCSANVKPRDCVDIQSSISNTSGVYTVYARCNNCPLTVYCDMTTTSGGWTVLQRRQNGSIDFYRNWTEYANGFGDVSGEFWIGNDNFNNLTSAKRYKLRIDLADFNGTTAYAEYDNFVVSSAADNYTLSSIGTYSGTAGDSLSFQLGQRFTTYDQDNDVSPNNCAVSFRGAWWYERCHYSNLNGFYYGGPHESWADGVEWYTWTGHQYSLKTTEMKIKPVI